MQWAREVDDLDKFDGIPITIIPYQINEMLTSF